MEERPLSEITLPGIHEALLQRVVELPELDLETPILDLGCGSGAWLARLAKHGFRNLYGVDNESFVPLPDSNATPFRCFHGDLEDDFDFGMTASKFGLITAIEVVEHLHSPGRLFRHVADHLADNGYFLMTTPNLHSVRARLRFAITDKLAGFDLTNVPVEETHVFPVFITCLDRMLSSYGLRTAERWTFPETRGTGSRSWARLLELLAAMGLPNNYPGDSLCVLIRKDAAVSEPRGKL